MKDMMGQTLGGFYPDEALLEKAMKNCGPSMIKWVEGAKRHWFIC